MPDRPKRTVSRSRVVSTFSGRNTGRHQIEGVGLSDPCACALARPAPRRVEPTPLMVRRPGSQGGRYDRVISN